MPGRTKPIDAVRTERELRRRVSELHERENAYLFENRIDDETYERQKAKLAEQIALAKIAAHDARLEELDVEGLLVFSEHLLNNAGGLWTEFPLDPRQRFQKILFPKGIAYGNSHFEPAETPVIFRMLHAVEGGKSNEATLAMPSWNQLLAALRELDALRRTEAA